MNFPTITRNNWMCCSIILVFLALGSPEPLQAQENQKERITIQVKNQQQIKKMMQTTKQIMLRQLLSKIQLKRVQKQVIKHQLNYLQWDVWYHY